jgi:hypothetical protein
MNPLTLKPTTTLFLHWLLPGLMTAAYATAAQWPDTRAIGPFVFRADFPLAELGSFPNELAQLHADLVSALAIPPVREPIEVYLFHDRQTYDGYMQQFFPGLPYRRAVYIKGNGPGRVFAYRTSDLEVDLRHECTHALLHASLKNIPLWLDEGLAGYFELPANRRLLNNPHLKSVRWNAWWGAVPKIENLEKCTDIAKMGKAEYRDSWAWVYFLLHSSAQAHEELVVYFRDLQRQNPPQPLSLRLKQKIPDINSSFALFFKK